MKIFLTLLVIAILVIFSGGCSEQIIEEPIPEAAPMSPQVSERDAFMAIEESGDTEWDLLLAGDTLCKDFGPLYAEYLEEDLGIDIRVTKKYKLGATSTDLLVRFRSDEKFRQAVKDAEVIILTIPYGWYEIPVEVMIGERYYEDLDGLGTYESLERAKQIVQSDMDAILKELSYLTGSNEKLIRIVDSYVFYANKVETTGVMEPVSSAFRDCNEYVENAAIEYNIPTIQVYDLFMGETGLENPVEAGLTTGLHPTEKGAELIAQMIREIGYFYGPKE